MPRRWDVAALALTRQRFPARAMELKHKVLWDGLVSPRPPHWKLFPVRLLGELCGAAREGG